MINTMLEHEPIKLEAFDEVLEEVEAEEDEEEKHKFSKCAAVWKASTKTQSTQTSPVDTADETKPVTTTSSASSNSSRTANLENEIESCGNVFILNRRKLFLICGFCESKYANMLQFSKHLNDCHSIFSGSYDDSCLGRSSWGGGVGGAGGMMSEAESDSETSGMIVKGGFQIRFVREGSLPPDAANISVLPTPPPSIDDTLLKHVPIKVEDETDDDVMLVEDSSTNFDENIESCGNIFVMNRRKLFLICGFCESKYANMELFAAHLHETHTIFQEDKEPIPEEEIIAPADVVVKTEPEELPSAVECRDMNTESAPPMVALPNGTSVDNEDIIPPEQVPAPRLSAVAPAAVKEKKIVIANIEVTPQEDQEEVMNLAVAVAAAAAAKEKKILKASRKQKETHLNVKTIKVSSLRDYFCKNEVPAPIFTCKDCPKTFTKHSRLVEHVRLHTGEKPFKCGECGKSFRIKLRMTEHQLRHRAEKAFICEICGLGLATRQDYALHQRHHNGDKRYACKECGKAFVRSSDLKTHLRIHSDERPFKCQICDLSFRANQNLIIHRRVHEGDKQFKCDYCDKRFLRKIDKRVHHRTHTGEKAFKCEICGRGYSAKVHVRRHIQKRHMDPLLNGDATDEDVKVGVKSKKHTKTAKKTRNKSFTCDSCPKLYCSKATLQKHIARLHSSSPVTDGDEKKPCPAALPTKTESPEAVGN